VVTAALVDRLSFGSDWRACALPAEGARGDPASVRGRMAMYRLLVERASERGFGDGAGLSPFWGYASQLVWQHRSGRLGDPAGDAIDPASWWGACNYALSVVPYRAAMQLALVPQLHIDEPPTAYRSALVVWRTAMQAIAMLAPGDDLDAVRVAVWRAHLASLEIATERHADELARLPAAEQRFVRGWVRMVDLFSAAGWRTDLERLVEPSRTVLPSRIITDLAALPDVERKTVASIGALADRPSWRWGIERAMWRWMMRTPAARTRAPERLRELLGRRRR
jgi:hypothetical protein